MITLTITGETMAEVLEKLVCQGYSLKTALPHAGEHIGAPGPVPSIPQPSAIPAYDDRMNAAIPATPIAPIPQQIPHGTPFAYTPVAQASPTQQPAAPVVPVTPPPAPPVPTAAAPAYTLDQVSRAGADLITVKPEAMGALLALMPKYGVQTLTQLKPEQLGAVAIELRGLGANI
jgi:hypothetical protein